MYCPFCRDCLVEGLQGRYNYLEGILIGQSCLPNQGLARARPTQICLGLAKDWKVQGAILAQQKLCDPHELDFPMERKTLENNGVKTPTLEFHVTDPTGQFKIRVEAFLEMLRKGVMLHQSHGCEGLSLGIAENRLAI